MYTFTAMDAGSDWSPRFAIFGDLGNVNAQSVGRLQEETQAGHFDAVLHVGESTCYWCRMSINLCLVLFFRINIAVAINVTIIIFL